MRELKKIKCTYTSGQKHWVGDGFHVYGLLRPSEELNKFMAMKYIENVWCFGPKDYDFFSSSRRATLESFL